MSRIFVIFRAFPTIVLFSTVIVLLIDFLLFLIIFHNAMTKVVRLGSKVCVVAVVRAKPILIQLEYMNLILKPKRLLVLI